ncbi:TIGR03663 family protein [Candidatus Sumerlaeota bacterium]|nr:TIGR03663 family protein [Candidatus Sumerlaeota bacterium]
MNQRRLLILLFFLIVAASRLAWLGARPVAHDESLFGVYAFHLADGEGYKYDPMLHGPLLLEAQALVFRALGDSQYTLRLFPALCGIALIAALWLLRPWLGRAGLWSAALLLLASPSILFYSRFLRNDAPFLLASLLCVACAGRAFGRGEKFYIIPALLSIALMVCIKENTIFVLFGMACYAALLIGMDQFLGRERRRRYNWHHPKLFDHPTLPTRRLALSLIFPLCFLLGALLFDQLLLTAILPDLELVGSAPFGVKFTLNRLAYIGFIAYLVLALSCNYAIQLLAERDGRDGVLHRALELIRRNVWLCGSGLLAATLLLLLVFTVGLTEPRTLLMLFRQTVAYWWHEHAAQRLGGPYHYYWPRLIVYEAPALLIVLVGAVGWLAQSRPARLIALPLCLLMIIALAIVNRGGFIDDLLNGPLACLHMTCIEHLLIAVMFIYWPLCYGVIQLARGRDRFSVFAVFWFAISLLCYSYAGEKAPWLTIHITLPLIVLAGLCLNRMSAWIEHRKTPRPWRIVGAALFALVLIWNAFNCWRACGPTSGDPREIIVHNHTTRELDAVAIEIQSLDEPVAICGEAVWPLTWYLRNQPDVLWEKPEDPHEFRIIVCNVNDFDDVDEISAIRERIIMRRHFELSYIDPYNPIAADAATPIQRWINAYHHLPVCCEYFIHRRITQKGTDIISASCAEQKIKVLRLD